MLGSVVCLLLVSAFQPIRSDFLNPQPMKIEVPSPQPIRSDIITPQPIGISDVAGPQPIRSDVSTPQPIRSDIFEYVLLNSTNERHPCDRKCIADAPMVCRYNFLLESYLTMSKACYDCPRKPEDCFKPDCIPGDGTGRPVTVINRMMPGPSIDVCLGDEVIIDVHNSLVSDSTSIHWHGHHQKNTPYMDGVPQVTQCPIPPGSVFRYNFHVRNPGTHFWHSHSGFQRADGAFGAFIVRQPEEQDPHSQLYDFDEHVLNILDWGRELGVGKFVAHHHGDGNNKPANLLVNGLGLFGANNVTMPVARFGVEKGYRYRFRVINAGFLNCPIEISVDNHTLVAISSDGSDFNATEVESIVTYAGERFDFVINADQPEDVYWIRFSGLMDCDERFTKAHQVALLEYKSSPKNYPAVVPTYETSRKPGKQLNPLNRGTEDTSKKYVTLPELQSLDPWDDSLKEEPDFQYYLSYDFYKMDNPHYHKFPEYGFKNVTNVKQQLLTPQLNHISMKLLPFPLLSQRNEIHADMICNETSMQKDGCESSYCECTHVVQLKLNSVVELILIDKGYAYDANHPFHLHGHSFRVVAMQRLGHTVNVSQVYSMDQKGEIVRNLRNPPVKDTVTVPDGGFTILRFKASNPGYWLFHCHIEFHVEVGMALVFKIGQDEEMPAVPHGFPKCGSYLPEEKCKTGLITYVKKIVGLDGDNCLFPNSGANNIISSLSVFVPFVVLLLMYSDIIRL